MRDIILGFVVLLLIYLIWQVLRFVFVGLKRRKAARSSEPLRFSEPGSVPETIQSSILGGDAGKSFSSVVYDSYQEVHEEPTLRAPPEPDASEFGFDALLEMRQLRHAFDELQGKVDVMQHEIGQLRESLTELRAASQVSPLYGEAVALAHRGYDAQAIAERCGISVAEAQLVLSLSGVNEEEGSNDGRTGSA